MANTRLLTCDICNRAFEAPRMTGRPPSRCGDACKRKAANRHQQNYMNRLMAARQQLEQLQAA
jgi:hypothetical protein